MFVKTIIANGVGGSSRACLFSLGTSFDPLGWLCELLGLRNEVLRWRLINEVQGSSVWENVAEASGFYGAGFRSGGGISTEPVVLTRARDVISA
jgi:hypothetical protein